jgi:hypothetical protein
MVSPVSNPILPATFGMKPPQPLNQNTTKNAQGDAVYSSDNYNITANTRGEITILNKQNNETTFIYGDPHVNVDGAYSFDFKETTTMILADGTKVTIDTEPWGTGGATVASRVTITHGDYGVQMGNVSLSNTQDEVTIAEYAGNGRLLDEAVDDGTTVLENDYGTGYLLLAQNEGSISFSTDAATQLGIDKEELTPGGMFDQKTTSNDVIASILEKEGGPEFLGNYFNSSPLNLTEEADETDETLVVDSDENSDDPQYVA